MGFFDTIARGWAISKLSFGVVWRDPELLVYMLFSSIMVGLTVLAGALPGIGYEMEMPLFDWAMTADPETGETTATPLYLAWIFVTYTVGATIVVFWNCAITFSAHMRLTGGDPRFMTGISAAMRHLPTIVAWGVITGIFGILMRLIRDAAANSKNPALQIAGAIFAFIAETAWWITTFFIIPMIVLEGKGVRDAFNSSKGLFTKTWGENITSGLGVGLIGFLLVLVAFAVGVPLILVGLVLPGIIAIVVLVLLAVLWTNTAEVVVVAALYEFARTGEMPDLDGAGKQVQQHLGWENESPEMQAWRKGTA
ncbi:MAG: DUF6159 family protein [Candidatus Poseidoniia archaeon]|jgi:hypothetical protein|nr:DUF6159 family protein [Candidatus Poseidoniia archaeon]MDP6658722.1 DUF6159 family protein [Candidatus Poseidoniia archaeon]MDP6846286.1 DUF6159 family protein [Candidatus Poseidoniia archaeon]MDP7007033.1 DUF6159 family protein [Candidatus Poseidoniia archaeon]|tara:strand:- start:486 stop:1415 length:930 start_codon:yes stop_codon:yes gene_type:complete